MLSFAAGVQPHLDVAPARRRARSPGRGGAAAASTTGTKRDAGALRAARMEELFRWLAVDDAR